MTSARPIHHGIQGAFELRRADVTLFARSHLGRTLSART